MVVVLEDVWSSDDYTGAVVLGVHIVCLRMVVVHDCCLGMVSLVKGEVCPRVSCPRCTLSVDCSRRGACPRVVGSERKLVLGLFVLGVVFLWILF